MRKIELSMRRPKDQDWPCEIAMIKRDAVNALLVAGGGFNHTGGGCRHGGAELSFEVRDVPGALSEIANAMQQAAPEMDYEIRVLARREPLDH